MLSRFLTPWAKRKMDVHTYLVEQRVLLTLLFLGVLIPLGILAKVADEVHEGDMLPLDEPILHFLHLHQSPRRSLLFTLITDLGRVPVMVPLCAAIVLWFAWRRRWPEARFFAIAVGGAAVLNLASKMFFARDRPNLWISIAPEYDYGFPSGHAMVTGALVTALVIIAWPTAGRWSVLGLGVVFALAVGFSRLYLGVHYPSDIVGGWCAALIWVVGTHLIFGAHRHGSRKAYLGAGENHQ